MSNGLKSAPEFESEYDAEAQEEEEQVHKKGHAKGVSKVAREEPVSYTQLATRVDSSLFRRIKIHCVATGTSIMEFVHSALVAELKKQKTK